MDTALMFSSKNQEWQTPQDFFDKLNGVFHFVLDPAATDANTMCSVYYTKDTNGLLADWDKVTFVNPPYGRGDSLTWVKKAYEEFQKHGQTIVMLLPARTCTKWFHEYCTKAHTNVFIKGRLKFKNIFIEKEYEEKMNQGKITAEEYAKVYPAPAPFPSLITIFTKELNLDQTQVLKEVGVMFAVVDKTIDTGKSISHGDNSFSWREI
jgi:site-specific DNA-methyltransferase (adenine-specific)